MEKKRASNFCKSLIFLFVLPVLCLGQTVGGGSLAESLNLSGGGKGNSGISTKLSSAIDKKVFVKLAQAGNRTKSRAKAVALRKTPPPNNRISKPAESIPIKPNNSAASVFNFQSPGETGFDRELADLLTQKPDEKKALLVIFSETKKAYQAEAEKAGRQNDLALALTFFISTCVTVYHNAPEPSDQATESLYHTLAESMLETPAIAQMSDQDKHLASDKMIYISGLILAGYMSSKETNDQETLKAYQKIAGNCLESLSGISAERMEFDKDGLKVKP